MGKRKRIAADARKEEMKSTAIAKLNNCPTSPRKMRLVADSVRGKDVFQALNILKFSPQEASNRLEKLLLSAIANWEAKNEGARPEEADLIIREVKVDSARMLKRLANSTSRSRAPHSQAQQPRNHHCRLRQKLIHGTENKSDWKSPWFHPRMGLELVRRQRLQGQACRR
jgi:large subunit ribosomal protein L22